MKTKYIELYMDWAHRAAQLSHAKRLKVGAVIVKDDSVISYGYNGMPAGWDNNCEYEVINLQAEYGRRISPIKTGELRTRPEVLHAEMNSLMKLAKSSSSGNTASMFVTHSPCVECAKGIFQAGLKEVFYSEDYRDDSGLNFLRKSGVEVIKYPRN